MNTFDKCCLTDLVNEYFRFNFEIDSEWNVYDNFLKVITIWNYDTKLIGCQHNSVLFLITYLTILTIKAKYCQRKS